MEVAEKTESKTSKIIKLLLKVAVTAACFWYISTKIDFTASVQALLHADWWWMVAAILLLMLSKLVSAFRLNIYFRNIGILLSNLSNIRLYWLGMFYNLFLPGAISGDAYKVIRLTRRFGISYKKTTAAVLIDRFSGVIALAILLAIAGIIVLDEKMYDYALGAAALFVVPIFYLIVKKFFPEFIPGFTATFLLGMCVQLIQVLCVVCILKSVDINTNYAAWIFIFLASAVVTVLPLSLGGGLGTREVVFVAGAKYFNLDPEIAVVISLLFYLTSVIASLWGVYYIFKDPLPWLNEKQQKKVVA